MGHIQSYTNLYSQSYLWAASAVIGGGFQVVSSLSQRDGQTAVDVRVCWKALLWICRVCSIISLRCKCPLCIMDEMDEEI